MDRDRKRDIQCEEKQWDGYEREIKGCGGYKDGGGLGGSGRRGKIQKMVDPSIDGHGRCVICDRACNREMHGSWNVARKTLLLLKSGCNVSSTKT